jgi:hypothetical protein
MPVFVLLPVAALLALWASPTRGSLALQSVGKFQQPSYKTKGFTSTSSSLFALAPQALVYQSTLSPFAARPAESFSSAPM